MPQLDEYVKIILETIEDCNLRENTVVIFQADHGVGEKHGEMFYGAFAYDSTSNVFSMIHIPGFEPNQISSQCQNIDFFPDIGYFFVHFKESSLASYSLFT